MKAQSWKDCILQKGIEGSNPSLSDKFKPRFCGVFKFIGIGREANCFASRRDSKGGAMFLFAKQGKNREPGLEEKSVRIFTGTANSLPLRKKFNRLNGGLIFFRLEQQQLLAVV